MNSTNFLPTIAIATALVSGAALARSAPEIGGDHEWTSPVLQVVPNSGLHGQESFGWRYFSDPDSAHAVVISPSGEYFLSLGDGPQQITGPTGQGATGQGARGKRAMGKRAMGQRATTHLAQD